MATSRLTKYQTSIATRSRQNCGTHFLVAFSSDINMAMVQAVQSDEYKNLETKEEKEDWFHALSRTPLADAIQSKGIHYGDPPNVHCCPAGPTMNCDDLRVCEYWRRDQAFDWQRHKQLEIALDSIYEEPEAQTE